MRENVRKLGVRYPVALDNDFVTWQSWHNQYWPAKYLIDKQGHVRYFHFGEGDYSKTEDAIRTLLGTDAPAATQLADESPHGQITPGDLPRLRTPRPLRRRAGREGQAARLHLPARLCEERARLQRHLDRGGRARVAGLSAGLRLQYRARDVYLVLTGKGKVDVLVDGKPERTVRVTDDRLYTLVQRPRLDEHLLELRFTPGVAAYAFTFG